MGSSEPEEKVSVIEKYLMTHNIGFVSFFDDSLKTVAAVKAYLDSIEMGNDVAHIREEEGSEKGRVKGITRGKSGLPGGYRPRAARLSLRFLGFSCGMFSFSGSELPRPQCLAIFWPNSLPNHAASQAPQCVLRARPATHLGRW